MQKMRGPDVGAISREVECLVVACCDYFTDMEHSSAKLILDLLNGPVMIDKNWHLDFFLQLKTLPSLAYATLSV